MTRFAPISNSDRTTRARPLRSSWVVEMLEQRTLLSVAAVVKDINPTPSYGSYPMHPIRVASRLYFVADDGTHGYQLWVSDGSDAATRMLTSGTPWGYRSGPQPELIGTDVSGTFIFVHGGQLWRSDGTVSGTFM